MQWFHQIKTIIRIVVHTQTFDGRITMTVVGHVKMDASNMVLDSVFLMFLPSQELGKS